jgi:hypothetical protein
MCDRQQTVLVPAGAVLKQKLQKRIAESVCVPDEALSCFSPPDLPYCTAGHNARNHGRHFDQAACFSSLLDITQDHRLVLWQSRQGCALQCTCCMM